MRKAFLLFFLTLFSGLTLLAQQTVTGKITDTNGLPVAGVSVKAKKSGKLALTGADGTFSLTLPAEDELEISSVGYVKQTVKTGSGPINITLAQSIEELGQVVLVGSRRAGRVKTETTAPVDVINISQVTAPTARMDLTSILNYTAPSFNYNKQSGSDGADHIDLATLRGLGPDQTLVLVNGKRRHQSAFVAMFGTRGRGNTGTDLNAIPASAIDRVEILRDGASAQYGSDAIAGVINIITKKTVNNITGSIGVSAFYDPKFNTAFESSLHKDYEHAGKLDGKALAGNINFGLPLGKKGGFINLTFDGIKTTKTFRQALKTANYQQDNDAMYLNIYRRGHGDGDLEAFGSFYNLEIPASSKISFYSFGGTNSKFSDAFAFTRNWSARPDRFPTDANGDLVFVPGIMKTGSDGEIWYSPHIQTRIKDFSATGGLKGVIFNNWTWDLSNTTGRNNFHFYGDKTFNASVGSAQQHFDDGGFSFLQNTSNLNFSREFIKNFNLGIGAEFRYENYKIYSGEAASYRNYDPSGDKASGAQGFPGYQPADVVNAKRHVFGAYADAEFDILPSWLMDLAVRLEQYNDFGFTHNYKIATRVKATKDVNIRGSFSTGFRAPSLQQINFSSTFTTVQAGNIAEVKIAPNYSNLAKAAGIPDLTQEKSLSGSVGFTWRASGSLNITVDGYITKIKDRVVISGQFDGSDPDLDANLRSLMAGLNVSYAQFFANAVNTTNAGVDIVIDYNKKFGDNRFRALLAGNLQTMKINKINVPDKLSGSAFLKQTFLSDREQKFILASAPGMKGALNLEYGRKKFTVGTRLTYFGKVTLLGYGQDGLGISPTVPLDNGSGDVPDQFNYSNKLVTDLYFSYPLVKKLTLHAGVDNLLNVHPDFGVTKGAKDWAYNTETGGAWDAVQMGSNGRRLFARLAFSF
ncbi:MAG: TonB-dependent receptor [Sphingobacteriales bacterium]|nr:TonB-dependent receptor [Sphingobacteriales bacterium]